ncbi:MAG TPA: L-aspartate oxidase [Planktothrix sp.]|jgi:L-aspartate oxidase
MSSTAKIIDADVLIVGSGLAGLLLALKLAEQSNKSIVLASKGLLMDSNSSFAQGGLAAVTNTNAFDSPDAHLIDTLKSGAELADPYTAESIIFGGAELIAELSRHGVNFDKTGAGGYELALEGGHSQARVLHSKDTTGRAVTSILSEKVKELSQKRENFRIIENAFAQDLFVVDGSCCGANLRCDQEGELCVFAPYTVLATGGVGQVFQRTTNPLVATGDGIALAYRAGARLIDMEFVQFHPTALCLEGKPAFLISEAVRGAGAILTDHNGKRFMKRFHHDAELATRDIVARSIHTVMHEYGLPNVHLDLRPIGQANIKSKFPNILKTCASYGIDILEQPIPIAPAAHYFMGGIEATVTGRTSLDGLFALGECACTGLHGANRLASNSLLEAGVMAIKLAEHLSKKPQRLLSSATRAAALDSVTTPHVVPADVERFRALMYSNAGLVRSEAGLRGIVEQQGMPIFEQLSRERARAANIFAVGKLIAQAALLRRESRGGHFRSDYPTLNSENFYRRLWLSKNGSGWVIPSAAPMTIHRQAALTA